MTIEVVQTCDGCLQERKLDIGDFETVEDMVKIGRRNGWANVMKKQHLCPQCIKKALEGGL